MKKKKRRNQRKLGKKKIIEKSIAFERWASYTLHTWVPKVGESTARISKDTCVQGFGSSDACSVVEELVQSDPDVGFRVVPEEVGVNSLPVEHTKRRLRHCPLQIDNRPGKNERNKKCRHSKLFYNQSYNFTPKNTKYPVDLGSVSESHTNRHGDPTRRYR